MSIANKKFVRLFQFLIAVISLVSPRKWGPFTDAYQETKFDHAFACSWGQGGEDLALDQLFNNLSRGRYIDVGAHHPSRFSTTRKLYQRGWNGINIEANPKLIGNFNRERKRDINLNFAAGTKPSYELAVFQEPAISTVNKNWERRFVSENNTVEQRVQVPGISLYQVLKQYPGENAFDLLLIDAEGADLEVLESMQWEKLPVALHPFAIMVEINPILEDISLNPMTILLQKYDYRIWCILPMSTIFIKSTDFK